MRILRNIAIFAPVLALAACSEAEYPEPTLEPGEWHDANTKRTGIVTTDSGLQYRVVQPGLADMPSPEGGQTIKVNYHGYFPDGKVFDSSYERGQPIEFPANGVIQGWIEALGMMKPCEARTLYIPGDLAYGPRGRGEIPPNATLLFNVQLLEVEADDGSRSVCPDDKILNDISAYAEE